MTTVKLLLIATVSSLIFGQIIRLSVLGPSAAITITDILVLVVDWVFLVYALFLKKSLLIPIKTSFPALIFILAAFSSLVLASSSFTPYQISLSSLFLIRFIIYFLISVVIYNIVKINEVRGWINIILSLGFLFIILGFIQLIFLPDLSFLTVLGWDPHQARIVSTLLDPNFSGMVFIIVFAFSISLYLYENRKIPVRYLYLIIAFFSFIATVFTFSRSSYLAFIVVALTVGLVKSPRVLIMSIAAFMITFSLMSQVRERIIGAFTLDETAKARIISWQRAITVFKDNPLFGVGFNTYRFTQAKYGFFENGDPGGGHSGAGSDSSILLVAATTGFFGSIFYGYLLLSILLTLTRKIRSSYLHLASSSSFLGLLVHSQFVNSLFFPQIMLLLWIMIALIQVNDS